MAAVVHKQTWKGPKMDAYVRSLLRQARHLTLIARVPFFNNDDVPAADQPNDGTTVGAAFKLLMHEGIIEAYRGSHPEQDIYGGVRRSTRKENHGHRNQLYQVASMRLFETWLERHGGESDVLQGKLF